jgi:hypothetical protein
MIVFRLYSQFDTQYFYEIGIRRFSFKTPPQLGPDVPYTFGIIGQFTVFVLHRS